MSYAYGATFSKVGTPASPPPSRSELTAGRQTPSPKTRPVAGTAIPPAGSTYSSGVGAKKDLSQGVYSSGTGAQKGSSYSSGAGGQSYGPGAPFKDGPGLRMGGTKVIVQGPAYLAPMAPQPGPAAFVPPPPPVIYQGGAPGPDGGGSGGGGGGGGGGDEKKDDEGKKMLMYGLVAIAVVGIGWYFVAQKGKS